ncbi:hypothetical protein L211DRAFT_804964 [Terfezia boudieri ATCC MYA-4762]|uniref:BTB domain-containing protein n=1 Tax=Terfezia boudieri ATCC MYA-4762 TaxID=1051890 RepID=A0A3N4LZW6_9PEZI|nr:hypothetical protein L211DRAFT_804964 [Terfezia boudieri ATCC MYA-4762]
MAGGIATPIELFTDCEQPTIAWLNLNKKDLGGVEEVEPRVSRIASITFDPIGDLMLVLGPPTCQARFHVSSKVLSLSSPVFRTMLNFKSGFKEGKDLAERTASSPPMELFLGDDNPNALAIILRIIHVQTRWVPQSLGPERLYEIAIISDKYDMRDSLDYWLEKWAPEQFEGTISVDKWLFIAFVCGRVAEFRALSRELMLECQADNDDNLIVPISTNNQESVTSFNPICEYIPQSIVAEIEAVRQQAIEVMLDRVDKRIENFSNPNKINCAEEQPLCDALVLGFLIREFHQAKSHPESTSLRKLFDGVSFPRRIILDNSTGGCCTTPVFGFCNGHQFRHTSLCSSCTKCTNCGKRYRAPEEKNHAIKCSPIPELKKQLEQVIELTLGLEYTRFSRQSIAEKAGYSHGEGDDLWDCIHYE